MLYYIFRYFKNIVANHKGFYKHNFDDLRYHNIFSIFNFKVTDLPDEDLLSHFNASNDFISDCIERQGGSCLVHCFRGRSRSATVVAAYLMHKNGYSAHKAIAKIRSKRPSINPHESFMAQLKMYESMDYTIDTTNIQLKVSLPFNNFYLLRINNIL